MVAPIKSRAIQRVFAKPPVPALFRFDRPPLGIYLSYLQRVVGAAHQTTEEGADGRGREKDGARERVAGGGKSKTTR
eukprot:7215899-Pyramimonas_sp.AAC.1